MKIEFGPFVVDSEGILIKDYYRVGIEDLWNIRNFKGADVWDWIIHLTEKDFVTPYNYNQLNTAFFFAQSYFSDKKPEKIIEASTYQTLYVQKQIMENRKRFDDLNTDKSVGFQQLDLKKMAEYREIEQEVKLL